MADAEGSMMVEVLRQRERLAEKVEEARRASVPDPAQLEEPDKPSLVEDGAWDWSRSYDYWRKWAEVEDKRADLEAEKERIERAKAAPPIQQCSHDRSAERRLFEMTPEQQLAEINWHKSLADAYLEEGHFGRALASYDRALVVFVYAFPEGEAESEFEDLKGRCHLNGALAALRAGLWDVALDHCAQAEAAGVAGAKLWYRRAVAHRERDDFDAATAALSRALELAPRDSACRGEHDVLAGKVKAYKARSKELARRALSGGDGGLGAGDGGDQMLAREEARRRAKHRSARQDENEALAVSRGRLSPVTRWLLAGGD